MDALQRRHDRVEQRKRLRKRHRAVLAQIPAQALALEKFHDDVGGVVFKKAVAHADDVRRVRKFRQRPRLVQAAG